MEANKLTVVLFLFLVAVLSVSGFLVYDALGSFTTQPSSQTGVATTLKIINPSTVSGAASSTLQINNPQGGSR